MLFKEKVNKRRTQDIPYKTAKYGFRHPRIPSVSYRFVKYTGYPRMGFRVRLRNIKN